MKKVQLLILVLALSVPRFLFLDQDAPAYMISGISQEDEAYYCIGGVNRYLADEHRIHASYEKADDELLQIVNTPLTYWSLKIFGNNYYGLRIPVVIVSILINLLIVFFAQSKRVSNWGLVFLTLFLSGEFYSFLFGRFYNPQVFCMLFITTVLFLIFSQRFKPLLTAYLVGFFCVLMVLGVYVYTLYFALAIYFWYLVVAIRKGTYHRFLVALAGGFTAFVFWMVYIVLADIDFKALLAELLVHGGGTDTQVSVGLLKRSAIALLEVIATNFFRYNLFLLPLFVVALFYAIRACRKDDFALLFISIVFMLLFQNFFVHSYPFKKHITLYPVLVLFLILKSEELIQWLRVEVSRPVLLLCALLSFTFLYYNYKLNNSEAYWAGFNYGYYENISQWIGISGLVISLVFTLVLFAQKFSTGLVPAFRLVAMASLLPGACLIADEFFVKRTYCTRDALTAMKSKIAGQYVLQEFSHSFQFYSDAKPAFSDYNKVAISKLNLDSFYHATQGYAIRKLFRNDSAAVCKAERPNVDVLWQNMKFTYLEKYPTRYYDYYLLKYTNN